MSSFDELRTALSDPEEIAGRSFGLLQELAQYRAANGDSPQTHELILRALEHRQAFGQGGVVVDALAREVGLFPYLDATNLSLRDRLAYEAHRPSGMADDIVMHHPQAAVYHALLGGDNVVLSAPTSFGKSLIIDAAIASGLYENVVIVVPTLALIDETRRRLTSRFRDQFKIITHSSQARGDRNVFVLTQERVLEYDDFPDIDLFVIDEFYKLNVRPDDDRAVLLNHAFYRLHRRAKQFYMLGPDVRGLSSGFNERVTYRYFGEPYKTVVSELHRVARVPGANEYDQLVELCRSLSDPTIVFCASVPRAREAARRLTEAGLGRPDPELNLAAEWLAANFHPDWHFTSAIRQGIGVHHARVPRAIGQYVVRMFNADRLPFLVCTSTLIEGVNTRAKNIVVFNNMINQSPLDLFTFNNIRGRSGRMRHHFVGRVFVFDEPPADELPEVDVPVVSQPDSTPDTLLIQIDEGDLTEASRERLRPYREQGLLAFETLRANAGVSPAVQLDLARELATNIDSYWPVLNWVGQPTYDQVLGVSRLMWGFFNGAGLVRGSMASAEQLTYFVWNLQQRPHAADVIRMMLNRPNPPTADEAVQRTLDFLRMWANFHYPKLLRTIDRIQRDVFTRADPPRAPGNFEWFAAQVENYFLDPTLVALDEYGIPIETARRLEAELIPNGDLDQVLNRLRALDVASAGLTPFEQLLVTNAQQSL